MALTKYLPASINQTVTYVTNGFSCDTTQTKFPLQMGVPIKSIYPFLVIPALATTACVAASNAWPGESISYTLNTNATLNGTQIVTAPITVDGVKGIELDCERCISITFAAELASDTEITVSGLDYRGVATEFTTGLSAGDTGTVGLYGPLCVAQSITASVDPGVDVSFGNESLFIGLPYLCIKSNYFIAGHYGSTTLTSTNVLTAGTGFRQGAAVNATTQAYGPRGCVELSGQSDGTSSLLFTYIIPGNDGEINNQLQNRIQSTISYCQVQQNSSGQYVWPNLTDYDLTGMQYPGDLTIATEYNALIAA